MAGGHAGRALDVIVEPVGASSRACRHRRRAAVPCGNAPRPAGAAPRRVASAGASVTRRCARGSPQAAPPRSRSAPAARASPADSLRARGSAPRAGRRTAPTAACASAASASGTTGSAASAFSRASASPERSPSASATSSVKLTTQPSVTFGVESGSRAPWSAAPGSRPARRTAALAASKVISPPPCSISRIWNRLRCRCARIVQSCDRGARGDGLDMNEVERLVVRRIAVEMKQRQRRRGHGARSISEPAGGERQRNSPRRQNEKPRQRRGLPILSMCASRVSGSAGLAVRRPPGRPDPARRSCCCCWPGFSARHPAARPPCCALLVLLLILIFVIWSSGVGVKISRPNG